MDFIGAAHMFSRRTEPPTRHRPCGCAEGSVGFLIGVSAVLLAYLLRSSWSAWEAGAAGVLPFALLAGGQRFGRARSRS
jgi:hypothetical protein